jgi:hypothetical protein
MCLRSLSLMLYFYEKRGARRNEDMVWKVAVVILLMTTLGASPAFAWRKYAGEYNPSTGWPGVRVTDDEGHVITVVSFVTPNVSFRTRSSRSGSTAPPRPSKSPS